MRAQADLPAARDNRRPVFGGGAMMHPAGPRRAEGGFFASYAWKAACIVLAVMFLRTMVIIARSTLPAIYCEIVDSVTKQASSTSVRTIRYSKAATLRFLLSIDINCTA
ncbi:hypothetical protein MRX96_036675 [Rhipicephalus microplus]